MSKLKEVFEKYQYEKIALYGLGTETKKALLSMEGRFEIIGLLDSFQEEGELYGKAILSLPRVIGQGVKLIIVVARPGSCKAIAKKIRDTCRSYGIALMDIRGKDLLEKKSVTYDFTNTEGDTRENLYRKIARADVISFDLFDTLVMRQVLLPTDIMELMDMTLRQKGIHISNFVSLRLEAEKRQAKYGAPTLERLYEDLLKRTGPVPISARELSEMEWAVDRKTLVARQAVCDIFSDCVRQGKKVYIVTDTYYRTAQIEEILRKCHLSGYAGLLVSCEYNTGKRQQLFEKLREKEGEKAYLHIGDDLTADIGMAGQNGMDTYHVFSGEELLDAVGNMGMENHMDSLAERLKIGLFAARLFNTPFWFETEERKIELQKAYDIGYLICAPMITDFVFWFQEQILQHGIRNVWFCARDGYLLRKMYQILDGSAETTYFQTSRMAAIRAGMTDESDIAYVDSMKFSGNVEENLRVRFGLESSLGNEKENIEKKGRKQESVEKNEGTQENTEKNGMTDTASDLLYYRDQILEKSVEERRKYKRYIGTLNIRSGDIAFFDFVAKGTTQMYVQRLVDHHLKGLYFLRLEPDFMSDKGLDIESFYSAREADESSIYDNYYVLETILTAPHSCVCGFDDNGDPVFAEETRKEKDMQCFMQVQEGILDYFRSYLELLPGNVVRQSRELDEVFLGLIHNLKIKDKDFMSLIVEDPFFNRMTDIRELI